MKLKKIIQANDKALSKLQHLKLLHSITLSHNKELLKVAKRLHKLNVMLQQELRNKQLQLNS